jgi:hypothetical protein
MDEFDVAVEFHGKHLSFPARLLMFGYSYKIEVEVNTIKVLFEPDEERNYRALVDESDRQTIDVELLGAVAAALHEALT